MKTSKWVVNIGKGFSLVSHQGIKIKTNKTPLGIYQNDEMRKTNNTSIREILCTGRSHTLVLGAYIGTTTLDSLRSLCFHKKNVYKCTPKFLCRNVDKGIIFYGQKLEIVMSINRMVMNKFYINT